MIRNLLKKLTFFFWLAPGFLLWASFPPMGECKDAYLALAPLLWLVRQGDVKKSVVRWFLNGFLFWFATLAWMPAIVKNGGPWPLVVLGWGVLATYCALYFAAFGYRATKVWSWVRTRGYVWRPWSLRSLSCGRALRSCGRVSSVVLRGISSASSR